MRTFVFFVAALLIIGGAWYAYTMGFLGVKGGAQTEVAEYAYTCANGMEFSMSPAEDMSWVAVFPGKNATFPQQTLSYQDNVSGMKYWTPGMSLVGAGEEITLALGTATTTCNPIPSQTEAPWNWGDPGEGAGIEQNLSVVVANSILGTWQSADDQRFRRQFKADGTYTDLYAGADTSSGLWNAFTKENAPDVAFPVEENSAYIQMAEKNGDVLYFKIISLTPGTLSMIYMDRGGVLNFNLVQE